MKRAPMCDLVVRFRLYRNELATVRNGDFCRSHCNTHQSKPVFESSCDFFFLFCYISHWKLNSWTGATPFIHEFWKMRRVFLDDGCRLSDFAFFARVVGKKPRTISFKWFPFSSAKFKLFNNFLFVLKN